MAFPLPPRYSITLGLNGEFLTFYSQGSEQSLILRNATVNQITDLNIVPNGTPAGNWRTLLKIFNTDYHVDKTNYECAEFTWETNIAFLNTFKGGTGTLRAFQIMMSAFPQIHLLADATGAECLRLKTNYRATDPAAAQLTDGWFALYKNTTSGLVKLWYNDGGTMKSVALT